MRFLDSIERLRAGLDYHVARHNLLTANLAHVDTPGFHPLDLERRANFEGALHSALASTDPAHLGGQAQPANYRVVEDPGASPGNDGNGVSLDREAVKIAANQLRYDTLATLVAGQLNQLGWAANDGRNG